VHQLHNLLLFICVGVTLVQHLRIIISKWEQYKDLWRYQKYKLGHKSFVQRGSPREKGKGKGAVTEEPPSDDRQRAHLQAGQALQRMQNIEGEKVGRKEDYHPTDVPVTGRPSSAFTLVAVSRQQTNSLPSPGT